MHKQIKCPILYIVAILCFSLQAAAGIQQRDKQASPRTLRTMARVYMTYGQYEQARQSAEKALSLAQSTHAETNELALCMIDLATVYGYLDKLSESETMFRRGIDLQKKALFDDHPYVAQTYRMLSDVQRRTGRLDKAEQSLSTAVSIMLRHCDIESNEMSPFVLESAKLYEAKGDFKQAQDTYETALVMFEDSYGPRHLMTANVLESMAQCSLRQHQFERADHYIGRAMVIQRQLFGRSNPIMIDTWLTKAQICRAKGEFDRSEYYLSQAIASVEKSKNAVTLARVYERINAIRGNGLVAVADIL